MRALSATVEARELDAPSLAPGEVERRAARGGALTAGSQALKTAVEAVGLLLLARTIAPADFGLIDMILAVTGVIDLLKDFGLSSATIQRARLDHAQVNVLFWINVASGLGLSVLTALLAPALALLYGRPELLPLALTLSLASFLGGLPLQQQALLRRNLEFRRLAIIDGISACGSTGLSVAAAYAELGPWALVVRQLSRPALQAVATWMLSPWKPSRYRAANVRELLRVGTQVSGFQLLNFCERNLDSVLVGRFAGPLELGFYTRAYEVMRAPLNLVNAPTAVVVIPALSRLAFDAERYRALYTAVTRLLLLATIPLAPLLIAAADPVLPWVLGPQWSGAVPLVRWLCAGLLIKPLVFTSSWLFVSQGRTAELLCFGVFASMVALVSFAVGLPWGALGVAASYTLIDLFFRAPVMLWWVGREGPVGSRDLFRCLAPAWTCVAAEGVALYAFSLADAAWSQAERTLVSVPAAWGLGWVATLATPWGRSCIRDGVSYLKMLRTAPDEKLLERRE